MQPTTQLLLGQDDRLVIVREQDVEPVLQQVERVQDETGGRGTDMHHAARIPAVVIEAYCNQRGVSFAEFMADPVHIKTMCNDPALTAFRIWPGQV